MRRNIEKELDDSFRSDSALTLKLGGAARRTNPLRAPPTASMRACSPFSYLNSTLYDFDAVEVMSPAAGFAVAVRPSPPAEDGRQEEAKAGAPLCCW